MRKIKYLLFSLLICFITFTTVSAVEFECKIGIYTITYNDNGEMVSAKKDGATINKYLSSSFKPKSQSECPTDETAKVSIIDGGRSLYVSKKEEEFTANPSYCGGYNIKDTCNAALNGTCVWNGKDTCLQKEKTNCLDFKDSTSCKNSPNVACIWNENEDAAGNQGGYCNVDNLLYVGCGGASDIPVQIPSLISMLVNLLKIATPIILIFISIITLLKAMSAGKEDEIKKATSSLVKKMIAGALVFFVIGIVQFVMSKVAEDDDYNGMTECFDCFLNNSCKQSTYYKTVVAGEDMCTRLTEGKTKACADLFKESE